MLSQMPFTIFEEQRNSEKRKDYREPLPLPFGKLDAAVFQNAERERNPY